MLDAADRPGLKKKTANQSENHDITVGTIPHPTCRNPPAPRDSTFVLLAQAGASPTATPRNQSVCRSFPCRGLGWQPSTAGDLNPCQFTGHYTPVGNPSTVVLRRETGTGGPICLHALDERGTLQFRRLKTLSQARMARPHPTRPVQTPLTTAMAEKTAKGVTRKGRITAAEAERLNKIRACSAGLSAQSEPPPTGNPRYWGEDSRGP